MDGHGAALLFMTAAPDSTRFARWITPGGGVDPGETHEQAAIRELFEETGLVVDDVGEPVWSLDFEVAWDDADHDRGHAEYYVVRCERFDPVSTNWTDDEHIGTSCCARASRSSRTTCRGFCVRPPGEFERLSI